MTAEEFETVVGRPPEIDELDRANCPEAGSLGHSLCGLCSGCGKPRHSCMDLREHERKPAS